MAHPSYALIAQVAAMHDPVARNFAITQCYRDLASAVGNRAGFDPAVDRAVAELVLLGNVQVPDSFLSPATPRRSLTRTDDRGGGESQDAGSRSQR
ncbi:MAG: hypothetical protein WAS02_06470 [Propionicimonas sp.]